MSGKISRPEARLSSRCAGGVLGEILGWVKK